MIKVEVKYILKSGQRYNFCSAIFVQKIDDSARRESGNLKYDFDIPEDEPDILYLHELWENQQALEAHAKMPHYAALAELKAKYVEETIIDKTEV
jgi:quinol monooxygenase YgiN